uniref:Uncharacterized protein n=1 Tax=viral metagenome TaxID=1070528 RepID=A0A6C0E5S3_9ZZZZ
MCDKISTTDYSPPWSRTEAKYIEPSEAVRQQLQMQKKGDVLQYNNNNFKLTKTQKYAQLVKGINSYRRKSFATQSETYTNPNFNNPICAPKKLCFTTDKSDVPGPIIPLCYDSSLPNTINVQRVFEIDSFFQQPTITSVAYLYDESKEQNIVSFDVNYDDIDEKQIFLYVDENDGNTRKINIYGKKKISIPISKTKTFCIVIDNGKTGKMSSDIVNVDQCPLIDIIENNNNVLTCEIAPFINIHGLKTCHIENTSYDINNDGYDDNIFNINIDHANQYMLTAKFNNESSTLFKSYPIIINPAIVLKMNTITLANSADYKIKTYILELSYYTKSFLNQSSVYSNMSLIYKYASSDEWISMQISQNNKTINVDGITQDTQFYLQYIDNDVLTKSNILNVSLTPPVLTFTSYIGGKLILNMKYTGSDNLLYKNYIPIPNTIDINNTTIDANKGDSFSYGIMSSLLSNIIKIPIPPRVRLNSVVHNASNNTYSINFVVYYDDNIIESKNQFVITDITGSTIQTITSIKRMQFLTIQADSRKILNIRTRFNCGDLYIDSSEVKILK